MRSTLNHFYLKPILQSFIFILLGNVSWFFVRFPRQPLRKKFFGSVYFRILTEFEYFRRKSLYSIRMQENTDQKNSKYGHFLRSECSSPEKLPTWKILTDGNIFLNVKGRITFEKDASLINIPLQLAYFRMISTVTFKTYCIENVIFWLVHQKQRFCRLENLKIIQEGQGLCIGQVTNFTWNFFTFLVRKFSLRIISPTMVSPWRSMVKTVWKCIKFITEVFFPHYKRSVITNRQTHLVNWIF